VLRSLGVNIEMTTSTEQALAVIHRDSDFDLLVTDVQRTGTSHRQMEKAVEIHEGVNFVVRLRTDRELPEHLRVVPVVFYAAYPIDALARHIGPARAFPPAAYFCNKPEELIPAIVKAIAEARAEPIVLEHEKVATGPPSEPG
jgi:CheY-like chemotaxis protein